MIFFRRWVIATSCAVSIGLVGFVAFLPAPVSAQVTDAGLAAIQQTTQLSSADPRVIAVRIINVALGLLAMIMVSLIVYAGFLWMTAGGDADQVKKAKLYIRNAIIGVIIILSSWAITLFVINKLLAATGGGGGVSGQGAWGGGGGGLGGGSSFSPFQVRTIVPTGAIGIRNVEVRILLTREVAFDSTPANLKVTRTSDNAPVDGTILTQGTLIVFTPKSACPAPNANRFCFDADTEYKVQVGGSLRSTGGQTIACGGFAPKCNATFKTGNLVDTQPPTAAITNPISGESVSENDTVPVVTHATDDAGVSFVETTMDGVSIGKDGPNTSSSALTFDAQIPWSTVGRGLHTLQSTAHDIDSNQSASPAVGVMVRAAHCFNDKQDVDETGFNCGGADCGACSGQACKANAECQAGVCVNGICVDQPVITGVNPSSGPPGSFVTVSGLNFGFKPGEVWFANLQAFPPQECSGITTWLPTRAVVAVPPGAQPGPIKVVNVESHLSDTTNGGPGPQLGDFQPSGQAHPGLCSVEPTHGAPGQSFELKGRWFGIRPGTVTVGGQNVTQFLSWGDTDIQLNTPVADEGTYPVSVVGAPGFATGTSNSLDYHVEQKEPIAVPVIDEIQPAQGPIGAYITLLGRGFGSRVGKVIFKKSGGETGSADVNFPPACSTNFWNDTSVVVKVPQTIGGLGQTPVLPGAYGVTLTRSDGAASNEVSFTVNTGAAIPGLCALTPDTGPVTTEVVITGERFGSNAGQVTFRGKNGQPIQAAVDPKKWTSTQIKTSVPAGAITGPVRVIASQLSSNGVNFQVQNCADTPGICGKETCCPSGMCSVNGQCPVAATNAEYAWRTSTGDIPEEPRVVEECSNPWNGLAQSPSPWNHRVGGDQVCINAELDIRFTTPLDPATVTTQSVIIRSCAEVGGAPCTPDQPVKGTLTLVPQTRDTIVFHPTKNLWAVSSTYAITLTTAIRSGAQIPMRENATTCGKGNAYCFGFTTRKDAALCHVEQVGVIPPKYQATGLHQDIGYYGLGLASAESCLQLITSGMDWAWWTGPNAPVAGPFDGRATAAGSVNDPPGRNTAIATTVGATNGDPNGVQINAEVNEAGAVTRGFAVKGTAKLFIDPQPPKVDAEGPGCDQACQNAAIWVRFNVSMDPKSISANNILLEHCTNGNCRIFDQAYDLQPGSIHPLGSATTTDGTFVKNNLLLIDDPSKAPGPAPYFLQPGGFYRVVLFRAGANHGNKGFLSESKLPLTGLNDPQGFTWTFRVKQGAEAICAADHVNVTPGKKIETSIGARQEFDAQPIGSPDACNASGQPLVADQDFAWTATNQSVARIVNGDPVCANGDCPVHRASVGGQCTNQCLNAGANGVFGRAANCGDSVVETTDADFCWKASNHAKPCLVNDPQGDCSTKIEHISCVILPLGSSGAEECDHGANNGPNDTCSRQCLWNPISPDVPNSTCGNGVINKGEQCDPGRQCVDANGKAGGVCQRDADCPQGNACQVVDANGCSRSCQALGASAAPNSICGNGSMDDGETCDYGKAVGPGSGCSAECLHEGAEPITSLCGDGVLKSGDGKSCEVHGGGKDVLEWDTTKNPPVQIVVAAPNGDWTTTCDPQTCLNRGRDACAKQGDAGCCGNGVIEAGKDCDLGFGSNVSGSGCSPRCLSEGSSFAYNPPSFCGDGRIDRPAEQCDALSQNANDYHVTGRQVAQITGLEDPGQGGVLLTPINASYPAGGKQGLASYGLQCGLTDPNQCLDAHGKPDPTQGLTAGGCCSLKPAIVASYPASDETGVCRNTLVTATFNGGMATSTITDHFVIATAPNLQDPTADPKTGCPKGTELLVPLKAPAPVGEWLKSLWNHLFSLLYVVSAEAAPLPQQTGWCVGQVRGTVRVKDGKSVTFQLQDALAPNTIYRAFFYGGPYGIRSARGVTSPEDDPIKTNGALLSWTFKTGNDVCLINQVSVSDTARQSKGVFRKPDESHIYQADAYTVKEDGTLAPIIPIPGLYDWRGNGWVSSAPIYVAAKNIVGADKLQGTVTALASGDSLIFGGVTIATDKVSPPNASTAGAVIEGSAEARVNLCGNLWPDPDTIGAFADENGSKALTHLINPIPDFADAFKGPFFNFSTVYCRDDGATSTQADDLPALEPHVTPVTPADAQAGILRQYILTYGNNQKFKKDGIGIRIASNPLHLSLDGWYAGKGFSGRPQKIAVDGYDAFDDGATVYVGGVNSTNAQDPKSGPLYSTIYVLSRNPDASATTVNIFQQLLKNLAFNVNFQQDGENVCKQTDAKGNSSIFISGQDAIGQDKLVPCTADWECERVQPGLYCGSIKAKLQRDSVRLADFQSLQSLLEAGHRKTATYPSIAGGSFLQTLATSRWSSWQNTLGNQLGSKSLPQDPINRFLSCGFCSKDTNVACSANNECPQDQVCQPLQDVQAGKTYTFDPATCWDVANKVYECPALKSGAISHVYQYRAVNGGKRYELSTDLEVTAPNVYQPPLITEVSKCSNADRVCQAAKDCDVADPKDAKKIVSKGLCQAVGGRWLYQGACQANTVIGTSNVCGDGVVGPNETCELGQTRPMACDVNGLKDSGTEIQICNDCKGFIAGPATTCSPNALCGNGSIDNKRCYQKDVNVPAGFKYGQSCQADADCTDPRDAKLGADKNMVCESVKKHGGTPETCDDGALNGTYGHCNRSCTGIGATCGDNQISLGETCDNGKANGQYCDPNDPNANPACVIGTSCSLDCRGQAPHCGDGQIEAPYEQCEIGNTQQTDKGICIVGNKGAPCVTDNDCGQGGPFSCGADPIFRQNNQGPEVWQCIPVSICSNDHTKNCTLATVVNDCGSPSAQCLTYPTFHTRTCGGLADGAIACHWSLGGWSACQPQNFCGDGHTDPGEACDQGNQNGNGSCTKDCRKNVCSDGILNIGAEECDYGVKNGQPCQNADYGSTCVACSNSCHFVTTSGGYCGDGSKNGPEQCDKNDFGKDANGNPAPPPTCKQLGYDYASQETCDHFEYCVGADGSVTVNKNQGGGGNGIGGNNGGQTFAQLCDGKDFSGGMSAVPGAFAAQVCKVPNAATDILSCSNQCTYFGCSRCQDDPGSGTISGQVFDAVYSNEPVPNARVTLYLRGIQIGDPTFADADGKFSFTTLNTRPECSVYRVVVDSYVDNPCTAKRPAGWDPKNNSQPSCNGQSWTLPFDVKEKQNGGYWPFQSDVFNADDFQSRYNKIYLIPRVGQDETLVVLTTVNDPKDYRPLQMHLVLPPTNSFGYCTDNNGGCSFLQTCATEQYSTCDTSPCPPEPFCRRYHPAKNTGSRDVWSNDVSLSLVYQASWLPFANIHCFDQNGNENKAQAHVKVMQSGQVFGCYLSQINDESLRFKRGAWSQGGNYSLLIVDPQHLGSLADYLKHVDAQVRIVTNDHLYTVNPPSATDNRCSDQNSWYWFVFQQDGSQGKNTIQNDLVCKGVTLPGESVPLPKPMNCVLDADGSAIDC